MLKYSSKLGTSNALGHFKKHEASEGTVTLDKFFIKKKSIVSAADKSNLIEAGVKFVSKDLRPFAAIKGEGMMDLAHTLWNMGAKYGQISRNELVEVMPCPPAISNNVRTKAQQQRGEMLTLLTAAVDQNPFISITCDVWQDNYRRISYLGVTIHYYNDEVKLCDQIISLQALDWKRKKDAPFIKETTKRVLLSNGIPFDPDKVIFVTDRGSNMKKAFRGFSRLNCFPHFLNNTAKEACKIDFIADTIKLCSDLVRYIKISGLNNEFEIPVKSAAPTRFNSYLVMIDSLIKNWDQLVELLNRENESERLEGIDKNEIVPGNIQTLVRFW